MNLLSKFFNPNGNNLPSITLVYVNLPQIEVNSIKSQILAIEPIADNIEVKIEKDFNDGEVLLADVVFEDHKISLIGIQSKVPKSVIDQSVIPSLWNADFKELIQSHNANIILKYEGESKDTIEQYLALYKVAKALFTTEMLGVINENAWTCHPVRFVKEIFTPGSINLCRTSPPLIYWTGFVQVAIEDGTWLLSKGNYFFNVPEFAYYAINEELIDIHQLFHEVFEYVYFQGKDLQTGDIIGLGESEYFEILDFMEEVKDLADKYPLFAANNDLFILNPIDKEELDQITNSNNSEI